VGQRRGDPGLVDEALDEVGLAGQVGQDLLDDDQALDTGQAGLARQEDLAHPPRAQRPDDVVPTESLACLIQCPPSAARS